MEKPQKNPLTRELLDELQRYCAQRYGLQSEVARSVGVTPQTLNNWFSEHKHPRGEQVLAIQKFLREQKSLEPVPAPKKPKAASPAKRSGKRARKPLA